MFTQAGFEDLAVEFQLRDPSADLVDLDGHCFGQFPEGERAAMLQQFEDALLALAGDSGGDFAGGLRAGGDGISDFGFRISD